uniref:Uncharacterized protein n=1 Tax=Chromera velia CCMP2878 TaxID=1169474 RepID=A0A0G4HW67_9ALVE|eukprot:Cvel_32550.t1-p1 / transcript=Cvel_32550.t1 / gene=Cvel_32550 / organism=Chromera_velia_CCMP2878 / gene_product=hypothetical protein / transcript_product=hypothetical protein / location=Cvel_scaffold5088:80-2794(+) / protein_length=715 / sequence_SO=supercontig / SO=protein_coding / is_pseudo=false
MQSRLHDSAGWLTRMVSLGVEKGGGWAGEGRRGGSGDSGRLRGKEGKDSLEGKDLQRPLLCDIEEASGVSGGADGEGGRGAQLELQEEQVKSEEEKERESGDKRRQGGGGEEAFETPSRPAQGFRGEEFAPGSAFRSSSMDERIAFHRYQSRTGSQETERTTRLMRLQGEDGGRRVRHDSREPSLPSPTRELLETGEWEEVDTEGHERERSMRGRDRRLATAFRRTGTTPAFSDSQGSTRRSAQVSHPHPAATSPIPFARSNPALQRANTGAVALPPFARRDSPGSTTRGRGRGGTTTFARTGSSASIASGGGGGSGLPGSATRRRDVNPKIEALLRATDLLEGGEWSGTSAPPQSGGVRGARDPVHLGGTMPSQQYPSMPSQSGSPLGESPTEEVFLGPGMRHSAASDGDELVQQQHGPGRRDGGGSVQDSAIGASLLGAAGSRVMSLEGHQLESEKETEEGVRPLRRTRTEERSLHGMGLGGGGEDIGGPSTAAKMPQGKPPPAPGTSPKKKGYFRQDSAPMSHGSSPSVSPGSRAPFCQPRQGTAPPVERDREAQNEQTQQRGDGGGKDETKTEIARAFLSHFAPSFRNLPTDQERRSVPVSPDKGGEGGALPSLRLSVSPGLGLDLWGWGVCLDELVEGAAMLRSAAAASCGGDAERAAGVRDMIRESLGRAVERLQMEMDALDSIAASAETGGAAQSAKQKGKPPCPPST